MNDTSQAVIRVAVLGAQGRMGRTVCAAVEAAPDMELVARVDAHDDVRGLLRAARADVAVDFTVPGVTQDTVQAALDAGAHVVVGTTGWTRESLDSLAGRLVGTGLGVIVAPNFALSAVLLMAFAARAARYFESVEVIELHHPDKVDAPSGTARHTAVAIAQARVGMPPVPDATESGHAARGLDMDGVHVHAVRLRGLVAHEEVLFGNPGETLSIRQDSFDRASFMPGVLLAVRTVGARPGLTVGLEDLLDLG